MLKTYASKCSTQEIFFAYRSKRRRQQNVVMFEKVVEISGAGPVRRNIVRRRPHALIARGQTAEILHLEPFSSSLTTSIIRMWAALVPISLRWLTTLKWTWRPAADCYQALRNYTGSYMQNISWTSRVTLSRATTNLCILWSVP